jgi:hypothetical protein
VDGANFMVREGSEREERESWLEDEWFTNDLDLDKLDLSCQLPSVHS